MTWEIGDRIITRRGRVGKFVAMHVNPDFAYVMFNTKYPGDLAAINVPRVVPVSNLQPHKPTLEDMLS